MGLLDDLQQKTIIADGAMGTLLYSYGVGHCFDELNLSQPDQVKKVHQAYLKAGAQVIQTNTYGANIEKLARYGLENQVRKINQHAVQIAEQAIRELKDTSANQQADKQQNENKYILGAIGGLRAVSSKSISLSEIKHSFQEQLGYLLEEKIDGVLLETYYDFEELTTVLETARQETSLPIVAQLSLHDVGIVQGGISLEDAFQRLQDLGANVIGLNCRLGPYHMIRSLEQISTPKHAVLSAYPNAGLPSYIDGHYKYSSEPEYFKEVAQSFYEHGVRLMGGCCGTTPEHIEAMAQTVKGKAPHTATKVKSSPVISKQQEPIATKALNESAQHTPKAEPLAVIAKKRPSVIVELDPPKKLDLDRFMDGARALKKAGVDAITLADNSLAQARISNMAIATILKEKLDIRPLVHIACRDRNLLGQQSHLMGLRTLGIDQVLALTGDPAKVGDFPGASSVFDLASFELIRLIKQFNEGISFSGQPLGLTSNFCVAGAFNPNVRHLSKAVQRLEKKIEHGADYFMSQPVYSVEQMKDIYEATKHLPTPIYIGIMPLTGHRNAEFLHHEVPGIKLTDDVRATMAKYKDDREQSTIEGTAMAKDLIDGALEYFNGIYLITPFMRYEMTVELTDYIHAKTRNRVAQ